MLGMLLGAQRGSSPSPPSPRTVVQLVPRRRKSPTEEGDVGGLRTLLKKKKRKKSCFSSSRERGHGGTGKAQRIRGFLQPRARAEPLAAPSAQAG